jgi:hypothetical protein
MLRLVRTLTLGATPYHELRVLLQCVAPNRARRQTAFVVGAGWLVLHGSCRLLLGHKVNTEHAGEVTAGKHHHLLHVALTLLTLPDFIHQALVVLLNLLVLNRKLSQCFI